MIDWDEDGYPDLVYIKVRDTAGAVEIQGV
jgi:hypothetical protein